MQKFKGLVYTLLKDPKVANSPFIKQLLNNFKSYWIDGFHPHVGKDVATHKPNPPEGHRHAHLIPSNFISNKNGYTSTKRCWTEWEKEPTKIAMHWNSNNTPTSDHGLFYAVDLKRNAYVFHYQSSDLHEFMHTNNFNTIVKQTESYLINKCIDLMPVIDQSDLFETKWLIKN